MSILTAVSAIGQLRRQTLGLIFLFLSLVSLVACASLNLKKLTINSMTATLPKNQGIAPGEKLHLVVSMTQADGKIISTQAAPADEGDDSDTETISWNDLTVAATVVLADKKGNISLPKDPRESDGKLPHIAITVPSHPDLHAELDIPVRYDRKFSATLQGPAGMNGFDGTSGINGSDGSIGSTDPDHPVSGGNGSDGTNGSDGDNGKPGGNGPPVEVLVALPQASHPLLQIQVSAEGRNTFFLIDPQGGSLNVTSAGGPGGRGGKGGAGGRGGNGGSGWPPGSSGRDGFSGQDGFNGADGSGGSITLIYDPQVQPYLAAIHLSNPGGPRPVLREEPVPPLW